MVLRKPRIPTSLFALICAFALVFSAFAHTPAPNLYGGANDLAEISATLLPGETPASLCINEDPDRNNATGDSCGFCTLAHGAIVCRPHTAFPVARHFGNENAPRYRRVFAISQYRPWAPSQGPPSFS